MNTYVELDVGAEMFFNGANFSDEYGRHVFSNQSHYRWDRRRGKRRKHDSDPDSALGPTRGSLQFLSVISDGSDVFIPPESQSQAFLVPSFSSCHSSDYVAAFRV